MGRGGYRDRQKRLNDRNPGSWATSSQDYLFVVSKLYALSWREAKRSANENWSAYAYAGIPLLVSSIHAFIVEYENIAQPKSDLQKILDLPATLERRYGITGSLLEDFKDLYEVRNELIHPAHLPPGTPDNWPEYLRRIKDLGLLNTTGGPDGDHHLLGQIASHRLFGWATDVAKRVFYAIAQSDPQRAPLYRHLLSNLEALWFPASDSEEDMRVLLRRA
jgi:hypothetical protein